MVRFLSPEWITALDDALRRAGSPPANDAGPNAMVIQHVVTDDADDGEGEIAYSLTVAATGGAVTAGRHAAPTVTYTQDRNCAAAIASGGRSAHDAFMLGALRITGDTHALISASNLLAWIDEALTEVRQTTSYDVD